MSVEEAILTFSTEPKAKLYGPATKAFTNPETGITVQKQGALRVIKDCAETTVNFLPIEIFLTYADPVKVLKGKLELTAVTDFYNRSKNNKITKVLLDLILTTCSHIITNPVVEFADNNDPYGDYDNTVQSNISNLTPVQLIMQTYS